MKEMPTGKFLNYIIVKKDTIINIFKSSSKSNAECRNPIKCAKAMHRKLEKL